MTTAIPEVDAMFSTDTEKTFQYDEQLPSLPVPTLDHTLNRYLDSVRPHVSPEEFRQTEFIVQQFASGVGKELQQKLLAKASTEKNWLSQWWLDYGYMDFREPLAPLLNFSGPGPYNKTIFPPKDGTQIERAGIVMYYVLHFWQLIEKERLKPDKDSKGTKFSMNQYRRGYNTCRIPGVQRDTLKSYFRTESEGGSPSHFIVMCKGRIFTVNIINNQGNLLTPPQLQQQFQYVKDICDKGPKGPGIGALTGHQRTSWAKARSRLIALHPDNYHNLETIQSSLCVASLEDATPKNETESFQLGLAGDPTNHWFDKSISFMFYKNGMVASNCDHSPIDAMVLVVGTYFVDLNIVKCQGKWQGDQTVGDLDPPRELKFHLDEEVHRSISNARQVYFKYANDLQCSVLNFTGYGKSFLRKYKLHPDTHVQLALQYTYYRLNNKPAPTYQTGTTRKFYNARTETVRSCTTEAIEWSKAMMDNNSSDSTRFGLYKSAAAKHNTLMEEATKNEGCDRHLFGLQVLAIEGGYPMPQIYTDPSYVKSGGGGNYVLSTSFVGYTSVYGGVVPMCHHGYGSFYRIEPKLMAIFVSSWKSYPGTDICKFTDTLKTSLEEMQRLIEDQSKMAARL